MRQKIRNAVTLITLLAFPVIMNFLSPYVPIDGAFSGIIAGSLIVFGALFLSGLFFGRAWCGWLCPMAAFAGFCENIQPKKANIKGTKISRYIVFSIWAAAIIAGFALAGGIKGIDFLHLTESGVSVDSPAKYIVYYGVLLIMLVLNLTVGKRGGCHSICWMSPFITAGYRLGQLFRLPRLRVKSAPEKCVSCGTCDKNCPMSINVSDSLKKGFVADAECIFCARCVDSCPKHALRMGIKVKNK